MELDKTFFEKVFSNKRMEKYFIAHPGNEALAITHYRCNVELPLYLDLGDCFTQCHCPRVTDSFRAGELVHSIVKNSWPGQLESLYYYG